MSRKKAIKEESSEKKESNEETIEEKSDEFEEVKTEEHKEKHSKESEAKAKKAKLAGIFEKAKELELSLGEQKQDLILKKELHEEVKEDTLVEIEDYLKSSIHLGTRVITPDMRKYVYKRRADGLAVFNTALLDKKIREAADFLSQFTPENIIIACKREAGWKAVRLFSKITGIREFTKKYPAGILTNPNLSDFIETDLVVISDPWIDKNALNDALKIKIPILAVCDTNNYTQGVTKVLPGNNKSAKSLGLIFYLLAKLYNEKRKIKNEIPPISEWIEGWENLVPPK